MNLSSPVWKNRWLVNGARWQVIRSQLLNIVYPNGLIQTGVDIIEPNFDYITAGIPLIAECSHITRYTNTSPGGRIGGTAQHQYLLYPNNPTGYCMVWCCGHTGWKNYREDDEKFTIQRFLLEGWHVLVVPMPAFDYLTNPIPAQNILTGGVWTNNAGVWSNVGGALHDYYEHDYALLSLDGGPNANRVFVDQITRAANQARIEINPTKMFLAGHSGGGGSGNFAAALDSKYTCWYCCTPGRPYNLAPNPSNPIDWESYLLNDIYTIFPEAYDMWGMLGIAAAVPGRRSAVVSTTGDEYHPILDVPTWTQDTQSISEYIAPSGGSWTYRLESGGVNDHRMTTARLNWLIADIHTNVI